MANSVCEVLLTEMPLRAPAESSSSETGAVVDFWGIVRETEGGAKILGINYEAHRVMAEHQLRGIADETAGQFPLTKIVIHHRIGFVPVGEASLFVRVGGGHRGETFRASAAIVEELKKRAPIWKHPIFNEATGSDSPAKAEAPSTILSPA